MRHSITIATAGHVDHGKTALVNRITGTDTDTLAEEKTRGLSINLGFAYHHLRAGSGDPRAGSTVGFVDVPGHVDFINNALAGIGAADMALLVVAADDGVMPQTREHLAILDLLSISAGAIVITKIDKVDQSRIEAVHAQMEKLVTGTSLADFPVFDVSSLTGAGLEPLTAHLERSLEQRADECLASRQWCRLALDRSFPVVGIGTVVTGTLLAGRIATGDMLLHSGSGQQVRIKSLRHDRDTVEQALVGERVAVNVSLPRDEFVRGDWLLDTPLYRKVFRFDARLRLLEPLEFRASSLYHLYVGTGHHLVRVRRLGEDGPYHQFICSEPLHVLHGDRFILRDPAGSHTVGGGQVIDTWVPHRGRSQSQRLEVLRLLEQDDLQALASLLELQQGGVDLQQFALDRNCNPFGIEQLLSDLHRWGISCVELTLNRGDLPLLLHRKYFDSYTGDILGNLSRFHELNGNQLGPSEPALNRLTGFLHSHRLFHALLNFLIESGSLKRTGTLLHAPDHEVQLSSDEKAFMGRIRPILQNAGFLAPRTREIAETTRMKLGTLERTLARARKAGSLIRVAPNRHYLPETIVRLAERAENLAVSSDEGFTVIEFRDNIGIGRNLCIEILEYFDSIGYTRREGNSRYLRTGKENLFNISTAEDE